MPYTVNVYEESAVTLIATYGLLQQGKSRVYSPVSPYFVLLCSSNVSEFDALFTSTVSDVLTTGVVELPTANGYVVGGKPVGTFGFESVPGQNLTVSWTAVGGTLSAQSALLCYRRPNVAGPAYSISSPIAMIDFGGTVTATAGTPLSFSWAASSYLVLDSIA